MLTPLSILLFHQIMVSTQLQYLLVKAILYPQWYFSNSQKFMSPRDHKIIFWWVGRLNTKVSFFAPNNIKQMIDVDTIFSSILPHHHEIARGLTVKLMIPVYRQFNCNLFWCKTLFSSTKTDKIRDFVIYNNKQSLSTQPQHLPAPIKS